MSNSKLESVSQKYELEMEHGDYCTSTILRIKK